MKRLYEFVSFKEEQVEEKIPGKNEKNEDIVEIKTVTKKVPVKFFLRKPNRPLGDEASLFESVQYSEAIKLGMLTKGQLASKFADEAKPYSEAERKDYDMNVAAIVAKQKEFQAASIKKDADMTPEEREKADSLFKDLVALQNKIQEFRAKENDLFSRTAEAWARNRLLLWWVFQLAHNHDETPLFGGGSYKDKLAMYDKFEEEDNFFMLRVSNKILLLVSFWLSGRAEESRDFDDMSKIAGIYEAE